MTNLTKSIHNSKSISGIENLNKLQDMLCTSKDHFQYVDQFGDVNYIRLDQQPDTSMCGCVRPAGSCSLCRTELEQLYFRKEKADQIQGEETFYYNDEQEVYDEY